MNKRNINFTIDKSDYQHMRADSIIHISSNTVNYVTAHFDLDEQWDEFTHIKAIWNTEYKMHPSVIDESGNTVVPFDILDTKADVYVNLQADVIEDDLLKARFTTYPTKAIIIDGSSQI